MIKTNQSTRKGRTAEGLRQDALLLFNLIHDENVPEDVRRQITSYVDELINDAPLADPAKNKPLFLRCFIESGAGGLTYPVGEILKRLKRGETAESIIRSFNRELEEQRARRESRALNKPEPKRKDTAEWRYWKLRRMEKAFAGSDEEAYRKAWDEFKSLLGDLMVDPNFWHVANARALLPHLLIARQELDRLDAHEKRSRAATKGAASRRKKGGAR